MLVDIVLKDQGTRLPGLRTLGIGASTYGSMMMGMHCYSMHQAADFLQLRIYRIDYDIWSQGTKKPKPHLIAKGTPSDARGTAENLDLFDVYWLDAAPQMIKSQWAPLPYQT